MPEGKAPVVWFEIRVADLQKAAKFYGSLCGWEFKPFVEYDDNYWLIHGDKDSIGGALVLFQGGATPKNGVVLFIRVTDLRVALERAKDLGATIEQSPKRISEGAGSFAMVQDPEGNLLGLWSSES